MLISYNMQILHSQQIIILCNNQRYVIITLIAKHYCSVTMIIGIMISVKYGEIYLFIHCKDVAFHRKLLFTTKVRI